MLLQLLLKYGVCMNIKQSSPKEGNLFKVQSDISDSQANSWPKLGMRFTRQF